MSGKGIRDVSIYMRHLLRQILDCCRPQIDLRRAIDLHPRVVDQVAVRPHPPYVGEVRRRTLGEPQHQLARDPPAIDKGQGDVLLRAESKNSVSNPTSMPDFDSNAK